MSRSAASFEEDGDKSSIISSITYSSVVDLDKWPSHKVLDAMHNCLSRRLGNPRLLLSFSFSLSCFLSSCSVCLLLAGGGGGGGGGNGGSGGGGGGGAKW